jgi:exonuclease III
MSTSKTKIISYNVRGIGEIRKRNSIFNFVRTNYDGIIYLQETHSTEKNELKWKTEWGGQVYFSHGTSGSKGVAILFSKKIKPIINEIIADPKGRYLILNITLNDENYILFNHYAPTKDKLSEQLKHLEIMKKLIQPYQEHNLILAGDFNTCLNPEIDKLGGRPEKPSETAKQLNTFMKDAGLVDIWRIRNQNTLRFTRRQKTKKKILYIRA